jgi:Domain of unknown function (DUF4395)
LSASGSAARGDPPVDPRDVRFGAVLTSAVLALVLLSSSGWLLAAQAVVFALGTFAGPRFSPYAVVYRVLIAPRLGLPARREDAAGVRFAQGVGLVLTAVGAVGYLAGLPVLGGGATVLVLGAALVNAAFGVCLGCELHPLTVRSKNHKQGATV